MSGSGDGVNRIYTVRAQATCRLSYAASGTARALASAPRRGAGARLRLLPARPWRDAVGVEHRVDVAQARYRALQGVRVGDLHHEAILDHRRGGQATRFDDVRARLRERAREVLEQSVAVPGVDLDLDDERGRELAVPGHAREALGILAQQCGVGAVLAVDRDPASQRDVAHDLVTGYRPTALGQAQHHVIDAVDLDPVLARGLGRRLARAPDTQHVRGAALAVRSLPLLEAL